MMKLGLNRKMEVNRVIRRMVLDNKAATSTYVLSEMTTEDAGDVQTCVINDLKIQRQANYVILHRLAYVLIMLEASPLRLQTVYYT